MALKNREMNESINLNKETEGSCSNRSENSSDIKLDISRTPAIESHPISRNLFPPSSAPPPPPRPATVTQLFQTSSSSSRPHQHQIGNNKEQESLTNMFCGMDDQSGFWPWLEQQHFS